MALSASFTHEDATPLWDSRKSAFLRATDTNVDFKRARYAGRHRRTPDGSGIVTKSRGESAAGIRQACCWRAWTRTTGQPRRLAV